MEQKPTYKELKEEIKKLKASIVSLNEKLRLSSNDKSIKTAEPIDLSADKNSFINTSQNTVSRFKALADASFEAIFMSVNGICIDQNKTAENIFGYSLEEALGRHGSEWIAPKDRDKVNYHMSIGYEKPYEVTALKKDGSMFPCEIQGRMIELEGKNTRITALRDITERKKAKRLLEDSENKYRSIFENSVAGIFQSTPEGYFIDVNSTFSSMLGYDSPDDLIASITDISIQYYADPNDRDTYQRILGKNGKVDDFIFKAKRKDQTELWVSNSTRAYFDDEGNLLHYEGVVKNITNRISAEEALRESEKRYKEILDKPPILFIIHQNGIIKYINRAGLSILKGEKPEDFMEKNIYDYVHGDYRSIALKRYEKIMRGENLPTMDMGLINLAGETVYAQISAMRFQYKNEPAVLVMAVDMSERKRAEKALEKRFVALTKPIDDTGGISFEELFDIDEIQHLQDVFAEATGVASIITRTDGTPITRPSNFCRLCQDIIRKTEKGLINCFKSDAAIGRLNFEGPTIQPCMSGGLWDAGAGIKVGGRHIANWLIGQVRDEAQTEEKILAYAKDIGADEAEVLKAFNEVPTMSFEAFEKVAEALYTLANQLSAFAYQNVSQARFIYEKARSELKLKQSEARFRELFHNMSSGVALFTVMDNGNDYIVGGLNKAGSVIIQRTREEVLGRRISEVMPGIKEAGVMEVFRRVWNTGLPEEIPSTYYRDEKSEYWAEVYVCKLPSGELTSIFNDTTAKIKAEADLAKSEERLNLALDSVTDAVWDWNVETGEVYFSSRWYTMLGYEPYEYPQSLETWRVLLHPDDLPEAENKIYSHLNIAEPFEIEFRMKTKKNGWKWILGRGKTVLTDKNGNAVRMVEPIWIYQIGKSSKNGCGIPRKWNP